MFTLFWLKTSTEFILWLHRLQIEYVKVLEEQHFWEYGGYICFSDQKV